MRILHLIDSLAGGGAERMLVDIANCTAAKGNDVLVCQTRSDGLLSRLLRDDVELLTLNRGSRLDWRPIRRFGGWVNDRSVDLIHVHGRSSLLFLSISKLLRSIRSRIIFHDHYGKIDVDKSVPMWFRFFGNRIDMYVGVSEQLSAWAIKSGLDRKKVIHLTNYLDFGRFNDHSKKDIRIELPDFAGVMLGVVVCGLRREKGVDRLLRALSMVGHDKVKLVIVGGEAEAGYLIECRELVAELSLQDNVVFAGQRMDIVDYLSSFDFAVIPSISESGPLVLIEYLMNGLPVIATRTGQVSSEVERAGIGIFVDPGDIQGLVNAINEMVRLNQAERTAIGSRGIEIASAKFDLNRNIDQWLDLYKHVLAGK